jgi:diacylglycerol kinase (ATP)
MAVNIDGEVVAQTPQDFSVVQNALNVLVPQDSSAARQDNGG